MKTNHRQRSPIPLAPVMAMDLSPRTDCKVKHTSHYPEKPSVFQSESSQFTKLYFHYSDIEVVFY